MGNTTGRARLDEAPSQAALRLPARLRELLGFHLRMAHSAFYRDFSVAMEPLELTQRQFAVLQIVAASPGVSQIDIAALLTMDRPTTMAIVNRLQERLLLERRRSVGDRRRQELHLTAAGLQLLQRADVVVTEHEKSLTAGFSQQERDTLAALLRRLYERSG